MSTRRAEGLSGNAKVPLRGLTQLLRHLPPAERDRLSSAFSEAEDLLDFHSPAVARAVNKRKISGLVDAPIITAESSVLGASVVWDRLNDPRISFYEVQAADTNTFASPETFTVLEAFFAIENVNTVKFIRVRGVRGADGQAGNWSNTERVRPTITAPRAFSSEFYQRYEGSDPTLIKPKKFGGPTFYTVLEDTFYMNRQTGGASVWGYMSARLSEDANAGNQPWDRIRWKVNGLVRMDQYFPLWTNTFPNDDDQAMINPNTNDPMSFYMLGGYTASFGPYSVPLPFSLEGDGANDARMITGPDAPGAAFYWANKILTKRPTRYDRGQFTGAKDTSAADEASVSGVTEGSTTNWLMLQEFDFKIPSDRNVSGIQVDVKRRQTGGGSDNTIETDRGLATVNLPLTSDAAGAEKVVTSDDVFDEVGFGKLLDLTGSTDGRLRTGGGGAAPTKLAMGIGQPWTWCGWFNFKDFPNTDPALSTYTLFNSNAVGIQNRIRILVVTAGAFSEMQVRLHDSTTTANQFARWDGPSDNPPTVEGLPFGLDETVHIAVRWTPNPTPVATDLEIYINGTLQPPRLNTINPNYAGNTDSPDRSVGIGAEGVGTSNGLFNGRAAQIGWWDKGLTAAEIAEIFQGSGGADLRSDFGDYESAANLQHYWLFFPGVGEMEDFEVFIVDEDGEIRDDLTNKAVTDEAWPIMSDFFYVEGTDNAVPTATAGGIPQDNEAGFGYQVYGGEVDLWGATQWTPAQVNDANFGVAFRGRNKPGNNPGTGFIDHIKMTVFTPRAGQRELNVSVEAGSVNRFYIEREIFAAVFNGIEVGERLVDLPEDC